MVCIPKTVRVIGKCAFYGCGSLKLVAFQEGSALKVVDAGAFANTQLQREEVELLLGATVSTDAFEDLVVCSEK